MFALLLLKLHLRLLIEHQNVQKKIQAEIDSVIGKLQTPRLANKTDMPYAMATVYEILRYSTITPLPTPHKARGDKVFEGYLIPKDTLILFNLWYIHHDPGVWTDPWSFQPERFLDTDGKLLAADHQIWNNFYPFSVGRRTCLGKTYATGRLFLYLASMLQSFDFCPSTNGRFPDNNPMHYENGIAIKIKDFECRVFPRQGINLNEDQN